ncbi:hypothetical protein D3C85_1466170 [compost metagenome]
MGWLEQAQSASRQRLASAIRAARQRRGQGVLQVIGGLPVLVVEFGQRRVLVVEQQAQALCDQLLFLELGGLLVVGRLQLGDRGLLFGQGALHVHNAAMADIERQRQQQASDPQYLAEGVHASTPPNSVNLASRSASLCSRWP